MKNKLAVVTIVAFFFYFLPIYGGRDESLNAHNLGITIRVIKWTPDGETERGDSNRRIFFHETSGMGNLSLRQTCTVESAAKNNLHRPIQIFMTTNQLDYSSPWLNVLQNYANVMVILVDPAEYFANTLLETWYKEEGWETSIYKVVHLSDYIRVLTLQKGGGMYMDLDIITIKPFDEQLLWNFYVIETKEMLLLSNSVMHFERGHRLINEMIKRLVLYYHQKDYFWHGPSMISNVMNKECGVIRGRPDSNICTDIRVMPHNTFAPISNSAAGILFEEATEETMAMVKNGSYGVHCWNGKTKYAPLDVHSNQVYAALAREHCPYTVATAGDFLS